MYFIVCNIIKKSLQGERTAMRLSKTSGEVRFMQHICKKQEANFLQRLRIMG